MDNIRQYFYKQLLFDYKISKFNSTCAGLLIILNKIQALYILLNYEMRSLLFSLDSIQFHSKQRADAFTIHNDTNEKILWFFLSINCFVVVLFLYRMVSYAVNELNDQKNLVKLLSSILRSYKYIFFIPSLFVSLSLQSNLALAILNMILVLIIQTGAFLINFDFQLMESENDYIQKFPTKYFEELSHLAMIFLILNNTKNIFAYQDILYFIFSTYNLMVVFQGNAFINKSIRLIDLIGYSIMLGLSLTLIYVRIVNIDVSLIFLSLVVFPLILKIVYFYEFSSFNLVKRYQDYKQKKSKNNTYFLIYSLIQNLKNINYIDYAQNQSSQVIDDIILNHKQTCLNYPDCYCYFQSETAQDVWDNIISDEKRKAFIMNYINQLLIQQMDDTQNEKLNDQKFSDQFLELKFIYINFLMNVSQSKTNCLYQVHMLQQRQKSLSLKFKMYLEFLSATIQKKKLEFQLNQQANQQFSFLLIEDKVDHLKKYYEKFLIDKLEVLNLIDKDYIQLDQFQFLALQLLQSKQQLQTHKLEISRKWRCNHLLTEIIPLLKKSIGFDLKQDYEHQINHIQGSSNYYFQQYINQATALISLEKDNINTIVKATQQFCDLFDISSPQGVDIYDFIPHEFQKEHQTLISQYLLQFSSDQTFQQREQISNKQRLNFVIAQTSQGFCIPLKIQFSIEYIQQIHQIVAFASFSPINDSSYFIVNQNNTQKIRFVSKNFYNQYLFNLIDMQQLQQMETSSFLPILGNFNQLHFPQNDNNEIQTYGILPTQEYFQRNRIYSQKNLIESFSKSQFYLNQFQVFKVDLKIHSLKKIKKSDLTIIEIVSIYNVSSEQEIFTAFDYLSQLLKKNQFISKDYPKENQEKTNNQNFQDSPDNEISSINIIDLMITPRQKQFHHHNINQIMQPTEQLNENEDNNQITNSKNNQKTFTEIADSNFLKINSQRSSLLTPKMNKNSLTTAHTFQDYIQIQQQCNKSYLDSLLNQLYANSVYRDHDEINMPSNTSKPIDSFIEIEQSFDQMKHFQNQSQYHQIQENLENTAKNINQKQFNRGYSIQSHFLFNKSQNNESSSLFYIQNNDINKVDKNKNKEENEKSSQNSGKTGHQIQIKTVYNKLANKKLNKSLFFLSLFGLFTLILIIGLSFFQFVKMVNGLKSIQFDLHFVSWPASISSTCNQIWMNINLLLIQNSKVFPQLSVSWTNYQLEIQQKLLQLQHYGQYIYHDQIISDYDIGWYFLDITYRRNSYYIPKQELPSTSVVKLLHEEDSELFFLQAYMANMYYYFLKLNDSKEQQLMITANYDIIQNDLKFLEQQISNSSISVDVYTVMIVIISLTFLQVLLTLPIYTFIQKEREVILKLFSTLQKQSIDKMKNSCKESLTLLTQSKSNQQQSVQTKSKNQKYKQTNICNQDKRQSVTSKIENIEAKKALVFQALEFNTKKKLISQTSSINKMNLLLPFYGFTVFVIISIQPILNSVLVQSFKQECITIFLGLDSLFAMKDSITKSVAFTYGNMYSKLVRSEDSYLYNPQFFEENLVNIFKESQEHFIKLQNIANTIQSQSNNSNKSYLQIITQIYQENICEVINQYPNLFTLKNQISFNYEQCKQIRGGILTKGFQVASQYFLNQMNDLYQISSISDTEIRKVRFIEWEYDFDVKEFETFYDYICFIVDFTQQIFLDNGYDKINDMWTTQYILVSTQIFLVFIIYVFGWRKFFKIVSNQLYRNKKIITLFDPDIIIDNPYFMNYISKLK
ncbi:hypothetical protein ABPG74_022636 [Tetrahymena malaccensis]